jgi:UDP-N-acetyl-D-glucosamine/UDP-N-acetyl-D-galactosamine dehydrogenase
MFEQIQAKEASIAVIGLGYVGLPLALEFAKKYKVIGYDINTERVELMKNKTDPSNELDSSAFDHTDILFTSNSKNLSTCNTYIIAVPTDIDEKKAPDIQLLLSASETVGRAIKKGDYVIFESTVYPGCTEEDCVPMIEQNSGLKLGIDFKVGYSPERINPGDRSKPLPSILKIVSGSDEVALENIARLYGSIITAGLHKAPSIKVAEAAKVIENTQRDLNISLMNELSIIFDKMNIDTSEVLEAAATKWNFIKLQPGLVGGHCIGVDPYYLLYKAHELGIEPQVIASGRRINDGMGAHIAKKLVQKLISNSINPGDARVLVMGVTFKENVSDIRNSKVVDLIKEIKGYSIEVEAFDPKADKQEYKQKYGMELMASLGKGYDAIILAVSHSEFRAIPPDEIKSRLNESSPILFDLKGIFSSLKTSTQYWRL